MEKLSAEQDAKLTELTERLTEAEGTVNNAFNALLAAVGEYNLLTDIVNEFLEEVEEQMRVCYTAGSENWANSERGAAYRRWIDTWADMAADEVEVTAPSFFLLAEQFKQLPRSV
jgi:hypothetical protein